MRRSREHGFGLVTAIFILVVMSLVGAIMLTVSGVSRRSTMLGVLGARAYHAGASGVEWGMYQALSGGACPAPTTLGLTEGGIAGFSVAVTCASTVHRENGTDITVFEIFADARFGNLGDLDHARRQLRGTVTNAP